MELLGAVATFVAVFSLLMALFAPSAGRRRSASRRCARPHCRGTRYQRLVSAERPVVGAAAGTAGRPHRRAPARPGRGRSTSGLIVRAGLDPAVLSPAEVYAAKLVAALGVLVVGAGADAAVRRRAAPRPGPSPTPPTSFRPSTSAGALGAARRSCCASCPTSWPLLRPLAEPGRMSLEHAFSETALALHAASEGRNLLASQVRRAVAAYGTGIDLYDRAARRGDHQRPRGA